MSKVDKQFDAIDLSNLGDKSTEANKAQKNGYISNKYDIILTKQKIRVQNAIDTGGHYLSAINKQIIRFYDSGWPLFTGMFLVFVVIVLCIVGGVMSGCGKYDYSESNTTIAKFNRMTSCSGIYFDVDICYNIEPGIYCYDKVKRRDVPSFTGTRLITLSGINYEGNLTSYKNSKGRKFICRAEFLFQVGNQTYSRKKSYIKSIIHKFTPMITTKYLRSNPNEIAFIVYPEHEKGINVLKFTGYMFAGIVISWLFLLFIAQCNR